MPTNNVSEIYKGPWLLDISHLEGILKNLPNGVMTGFRTAQPGFDAVLAELKENVAKYAADAGISLDVYTHFTECGDNIAKIDEVINTVRRLAEVLIETRALLEHDRQHDVGLFADSVKSMSRRRRDPGIAAHFEKTIKYNGQAARLAAKTRKKNAASASGTPGKPGKPGTPETDAPKPGAVQTKAAPTDTSAAGAVNTPAPTAQS